MVLRGCTWDAGVGAQVSYGLGGGTIAARSPEPVLADMPTLAHIAACI